MDTPHLMGRKTGKDKYKKAKHPAALKPMAQQLLDWQVGSQTAVLHQLLLTFWQRNGEIIISTLNPSTRSSSNKTKLA